MSNKDLLFEIAKHASIVEMQIKRLKKKPDDIHEMDIDMLAEKLKDLYSLVFELETGKSIKEIPDAPVVTVVEKPPLVEVKPEPEMPSPNAPEINMEAEESPEPDSPLEVESVKEEEINPEEPPSPSPDPDPTPDAQRPEPNPTPDAGRPEPDPLPDARRPEPDPLPDAGSPEPDAPKTTADLFTGATTIADSFQSAEDKSIAARVIPQAIEDLKMAIGINDKFLFINELFKGSPSEYNEAIEKLNASGELHNAESSLNTYKSQYDWSDQSEAYNRLKKIVHAKYMTS